ncbi:MAG TPA: hypothetical protein VKE50_02130 [Thermoanaerobaculia bacterium]|nr:hypothetical protein [Thermoanaerobaculia bacterium]
MRDRGLVAGIVLAAVGVYIILSRSVGFGGAGPLLILIGTVFLALSAARHWRGPIAPGAILMGLGAGLLLQGSWESWMPRWATIVLGLGAGFLLAAALEAAAGRLRRPGPIAPGVILVVIAIVAAANQRLNLDPFFRHLDFLWPWALVALGLILVFRALKGRQT